MATGFALRNHCCRTDRYTEEICPQTMLESFEISGKLTADWVASSTLTVLFTKPFWLWSHLLRREVQVYMAQRSDLCFLTSPVALDVRQRLQRMRRYLPDGLANKGCWMLGWFF